MEKEQSKKISPFLFVLEILGSYFVVWCFTLGITVLNDYFIGGKQHISENILTNLWTTALVSILGVILLFWCLIKNDKKHKQ